MNSDQLKGYSVAIAHLAHHMRVSSHEFVDDDNVDITDMNTLFDSMSDEQKIMETQLFEISETISETYDVPYATVLDDAMHEAMLQEFNV